MNGTGSLRSGLTLLARIRGNAGELITQASLSAIAYTVRNLTSATTIALDQALTISACIFDNLQQFDPRWDRDSQSRPGPDGAHGFNFCAVIPATNFTGYTVGSDAPYVVTSHIFQIDVCFTPTSGQKFYQSWRFSSLPVYGS